MSAANNEHPNDAVPKKFRLTEETITSRHPASDGEYYRVDFHRIEAVRDIPAIGVKAGDKGGFVQGEYNLSHAGNAWVANDAEVCMHARVTDDAWVGDGARVSGWAKVRDRARVGEYAIVCDYAEVFKTTEVYGHTLVNEFVRIGGAVRITGNSWNRGFFVGTRL